MNEDLEVFYQRGENGDPPGGLLPAAAKYYREKEGSINNSPVMQTTSKRKRSDNGKFNSIDKQQINFK